MKIVLDTSALVRFFTNDIPEKADQVEELLNNKKTIVPDVVFPELEYVLEKSYASSRDEILAAYKVIVSKEDIKVSYVAKQAVQIYEETKLDMADCIIAASSIDGRIASFDRDLLKIPSVTSFWK